jgi:hypothetical protein
MKPWLLLAALALLGCRTTSTDRDWRALVHERLDLYGHRNWIAVVDSAYPAQANEAIETLAIRASQLEVLQVALAAVREAGHVRPGVVLDRELERVSEADAPGIGAHRAALARILAGMDVERRPHEEILRELDRTAELFRVLVLKTDLALPYTSVFVRLECGYWSDEAEARLRASPADGAGVR